MSDATRSWPHYGAKVAAHKVVDDTLWVPKDIVAPKVYLAGHIFADEYRATAKQWLEANGLDYIDPMDGERDFRGIEDDHVDEIVYGDLIDIAKSDVILANFAIQSIGTSMECWHAHSIGRPVVSFVEESHRISPWLRFVSTGVYLGLAEALAAVKFLAEV